MRNIEAARRRAKARLTDTCRVFRDEGGRSDDTLNRTTLKLDKPAPDADIVYHGPCLVGESRRTGDSSEPGGPEIPDAPYRLRLPMGEEDVRRGDVVEILDSVNDHVVGLMLRIIKDEQHSVAVTRRYPCRAEDNP